MGCGCGGGSGVTVNTSNTTIVRRAGVSLSKCPELREVLRSLDLRVINLLNINNKPILQETNRQLRMWMRNLSNYCPTEEELEIIREFINKEEISNG